MQVTDERQLVWFWPKKQTVEGGLEVVCGLEVVGGLKVVGGLEVVGGASKL
jgi:hypothetical protein